MNKLIINKKILVVGLAMLITLLAIIGFNQKVFGNISYFAPTAASATATSSPQFLVNNNSTQSTSTPVVYDSYGIDGTNQSGQIVNATDYVTLLEYVVASSTSSVFVTNVEYSDGVVGVSCVSTPNACDWYANNLETYAAGAIAIATPNTYTYTYASTTPGGGAVVAGSNRGSKAIGLKVPTRYIRAYVTISGANGSVYLKWQPKKQQ